MAYRYIAGISLAVLTALLSTGCVAEEPAPERATPTMVVLATATAQPATVTPIPTVTSVPSVTPTVPPVNLPTTAPSSTPLPTRTAMPSPSTTPTPTPVPTAITTTALTVHSVGEQIALGELTVFVAGWNTFLGNALAEPGQGNAFVAIDLVVVNSSDTLISVSESLRISLMDTTGASYALDQIASVVAGRGTVGGAMNPGERLRGNVVFEVPASANDMQLSLATTADSTVLVDLGGSPVAQSVPQMLEGEVSQATTQIGQEADSGGGIMLAVVGWSELPGGLLFDPPEGQKGVVVELVVSNQGTSPISIASLVQAAIKDGDSRRYGSDLLTTLAAGSTLGGELASGQSIRGKVGFSVPADAEGLVLTFDASVFGGGKVFVELGSDPVSVAPAER